jgi:hypothetical protein
MTSHRQAAVWIDHQEARIFHVEAERFDESTISAPHPHETVDHPTDRQIVAYASRYFNLGEAGVL